jgi:hypothetical protein
MPTHKFQIGASVFVNPSIGLNIPGGAYIVTATLPERDGELEYRVRNASEPHERVMRESQMQEIS